jgi:hypothetical protein
VKSQTPPLPVPVPPLLHKRKPGGLAGIPLGVTTYGTGQQMCDVKLKKSLLYFRGKGRQGDPGQTQRISGFQVGLPISEVFGRLQIWKPLTEPSHLQNQSALSVGCPSVWAANRNTQTGLLVHWHRGVIQM